MRRFQTLTLNFSLIFCVVFGLDNLVWAECKPGDQKCVNQEKLIILNQKIEQNPNEADLFRLRGEINLRSGNKEQALSDFNKTIEIDPNHYAAHVDRSVIYLSENDFEKALEDLNKIVQLKPEDKFSYSQRSKIYLGMSKFGEALNDINKAMALAPDYALHYLDRASIYYEKDDLDLALVDANKANQLDPKLDAGFYETRGKIYFKKGDFDLSISDLQKALSSLEKEEMYIWEFLRTKMILAEVYKAKGEATPADFYFDEIFDALKERNNSANETVKIILKELNKASGKEYKL